MSEYFKFCPKCGRVLDREWCPHCEPEKEKKFRKEQSKLDRDMVESYSKDSVWKQVPWRHGGNKPKIKTSSKKLTEKKKEDSAGKKTSSLSKIFAAAVIIIPLFFEIFSNTSVRTIFDNIKLPDVIGENLPFSEKEETVTNFGYETVSYETMEEHSDYRVDDVSLLYEEEYDLNSYEVDGEEYAYHIYRPVIQTEDGKEIGGDAQEQIDAVCLSWYQEGQKAEEEKQKINAYLFAYTTYLDEDTACIVLRGSRYYDNDIKTQKNTEELYSFIIDLDQMTVYDPLYGETLDDIELYEKVEEMEYSYRLTQEDFKEMLHKREYDTVIDAQGNLWIGIRMDDEYDTIINIPLGKHILD